MTTSRSTAWPTGNASCRARSSFNTLDRQQVWVKRVVAGPDDRVELRAGSSTATASRWMAYIVRAGNQLPPVRVPQITSVLGDNRDNSDDSRLGPAASACGGKVVVSALGAQGCPGTLLIEATAARSETETASTLVNARRTDGRGPSSSFVLVGAGGAGERARRIMAACVTSPGFTERARLNGGELLPLVAYVDEPAAECVVL